MINLLPKTDNTGQTAFKYKNTAFWITHLGLIFYFLFLVATTTKMWRGNVRQKQLILDIANLEAQLKPLSNVEAVVLQIDRTQKSIDKFKTSRPKLAEFVNTLNSKPSSIIIENWDYKVSGKSRISVESPSQNDLEEYTKLLKLKFSGLLLEQTVTKGGVWNSILVLK
ncbi:hypothetical protein HZB69_02855 [Candidatus Amesbacteria bacterium]|nr:hypothetical protein [Candidatus Amesbacteria bacterium]